MSFYSDANVSTKYIDPSIYTPNARTTFQLDAMEAAYLPNLRLLFMGVTAGSQQDYNRLVGALALIKNIRLLDGKTVLCSMNEAQFYQGFNNVNRSNGANESVHSYQACNGLGLSVNGENNTIARTVQKLQANTTPATTTSSTLDLRSILPMLNSVSHLPTAVFRNLNLQIEYDATPDSQILMDISALFDTLRPVLCADVIDNPTVVDNLNSKLTNATWTEWEHDLFIIPAAPNDGGGPDQEVVQPVNVQLNGFNNKRLERLLICKEIGTAAKELNGNIVQGVGGKYSSQACFRQKVQFRVNGRNILPRQGIVGDNERLAHVVDTFGECTAFIGSNTYGAGGTITDYLELGRQRLGQLDYIGIYLGEYINNLQIRYERTGLEDNTLKRPTTDLLRAHCYGEVRKALIIGGPTGYRIVYAQ